MGNMQSGLSRGGAVGEGRREGVGETHSEGSFSANYSDYFVYCVVLFPFPKGMQYLNFSLEAINKSPYVTELHFLTCKGCEEDHMTCLAMYLVDSKLLLL